MPLVSCIMSNYNTNVKMFRVAIESVLEQSLTDFELILIDDCSTDQESRRIIEEYSSRDKRIVPIYNKNNLGLAAALNEGLKIAKGKYIARFDTDDICLPNWLEEEISYMEKQHAQVCSSFSHLFGGENGIVSTMFYSADEVKAALMFSCHLYHTTAIFLRDFLSRNSIMYDPDFNGAEDFDIFQRCFSAGAKICIIPQVLFHYRMHDQSTCHTEKSKQKKLTWLLCKRQLNLLNADCTDSEIYAHKVLCGLAEFRPTDYQLVSNWCSKLIMMNTQKKLFDQKAFEKIVYNRFFRAVLKSNVETHKKVKILLQNRKLASMTNLNSQLYKIRFEKKNIREMERALNDL